MHQQVAYYGGVVWCKLSWHTCNEIMIEHVVNDAMAKFIALLTKISCTQQIIDYYRFDIK